MGSVAVGTEAREYNDTTFPERSINCLDHILHGDRREPEYCDCDLESNVAESKGCAVEIHEKKKLSDGSSRGGEVVKSFTVYVRLFGPMAESKTPTVTAVVSSRLVAGVMEQKNSALAQLFGSPEVCGGVASVAQKI